MEFLLFDVSATGLFLLGYMTVVSLKRQRALPVLATMSRRPHPTGRPAPAIGERKPGEARKERPTEPVSCCREWPRLSAPR
jgi:hypothetical protein